MKILLHCYDNSSEFRCWFLFEILCSLDLPWQFLGEQLQQLLLRCLKFHEVALLAAQVNPDYSAHFADNSSQHLVLWHIQYTLVFSVGLS